MRGVETVVIRYCVLQTVFFRSCVPAGSRPLAPALAHYSTVSRNSHPLLCSSDHVSRQARGRWHPPSPTTALSVETVIRCCVLQIMCPGRLAAAGTRPCPLHAPPAQHLALAPQRSRPQTCFESLPPPFRRRKSCAKVGELPFPTCAAGLARPRLPPALPAPPA